MATERTLSVDTAAPRHPRRQIFKDSLLATETADYYWEMDIPPEFDSVDVEIQMGSGSAASVTITPYVSKDSADTGGPTHTGTVADCPWNREFGSLEALKIEVTGNDKAFRVYVRLQQER